MSVKCKEIVIDDSCIADAMCKKSFFKADNLLKKNGILLFGAGLNGLHIGATLASKLTVA